MSNNKITGTETDRSKVILVVDDCDLMRPLIGEILAHFGHKTIFAANGLVGLEMGSRYRPDAVLMDVDMPVMNGVDAAIRLQENPATEDIPLLFCTATPQATISERTQLLANCRRILNKPFDFDQLKNAMGRRLELPTPTV